MKPQGPGDLHYGKRRSLQPSKKQRLGRGSADRVSCPHASGIAIQIRSLAQQLIWRRRNGVGRSRWRFA